MPKTYTYTARGAEDPARVITFTLHDHHLTAEFIMPPEEMTQRLKAAAGRVDAGSVQDLETDRWIAAVAEPLRQHGDTPFALDDVDASTDGAALRVTAWSHGDDRHLQPIVIALEQVDNPQGAAAFADEVNRRKRMMRRRARMMRAIRGQMVWYVAGFMAAMWLTSRWRKKPFA